MNYFNKLIDLMTLGSPRPFWRLAAYYALLVSVGTALFHFFPLLGGVISGERIGQITAIPSFLQDGLTSGPIPAPDEGITSRVGFALTTSFVFVSTIALMLPVTWVYMSARSGQGHNQSVVQALIVLPLIVAGIVLIVRNSLALAFSLGGVVAAVRFRTNLSDARDVVFIFVAIAVGFAAGVQVLVVAILLTFIFNFVLIAIWRYDFGRAVLEPTAASQWAAPLNDLAGKDRGGNVVPDRDLVLALTPKKVDALAERFARVRNILGPKGKKPRFDSVLSVTTSKLHDAQRSIESALDQVAKRWRLDGVVTNTENKPSELYYLLRTRASLNRDDVLKAIRERSNGAVIEAQLEVGEAMAKEAAEARLERKMQEQQPV